MLTISLILNAILSVGLLVVWMKAHRDLRKAKETTFAGCLGAITDGLLNKDEEERWKRVATGLSRNMQGAMTPEDLTRRLVRASFIRQIRTEPALVDLGGEHTRALVYSAIKGEDMADEVWVYIDGMLGDLERENEPLDRFSQKDLAQAQLQLEARIAGAYSESLKSPPRASSNA